MTIFVKSPEEWEDLSRYLQYSKGCKWCDGDNLTEWNPFEKAQEVFLLDEPSFVLVIEDENRCYFFGSSEYSLGVTAAEYLAEHCPEPFNNRISIEDILNDSLVSPAGACKAE